MRFVILAALVAASPALAQTAPTPEDWQAALNEANAQVSICGNRAESLAVELAKAKKQIDAAKETPKESAK